MHHKLIVAMLLVLGSAGSAQAAVNLVTNGDFELSTYTQSSEFGVAFGGQGVTGWTATLPNGYSNYWFSANASTVNSLNRFNSPNEKLAPTYTGPSPVGGNFVGIDGDVADGFASPLVQTINGLTVGSRYNVDFFYALTQLQSRTGPTTNEVQVTFGGVTQTTGVVALPSRGFIDWSAQRFTFTATSTSEVLSFMSVGGPGGLPPYALLDGVSLTAVPETSVWVMLIAGFGLVGASARRGRAPVVAA